MWGYTYMRSSKIALIMAIIIAIPFAVTAGVVIQNRDLNIVDGNIILSKGGIIGTTGILNILSNVSVNGSLDAQTLTANSLSVGSSTISNSLVVSGISSMHNIVPGTGEWNIGSVTQPWAWVFGKTLYAQNALCLSGTCIASWDEVNQSSGSVTGTGTPNYLAKWDSTGTGITTSIIYDNGTNVGVDTNTPSYKLDVAGTIRGSALIVNKYGYSVRNNAGFITLPGPTSDYIITIQDGTGRIEHYWNASPGTSPTYLVSNEAAGKMLINPAGNPWFALQWAPAGTAGATITWQTKFSVYQDGSIVASSFKDLQNTAYYIDPAGTSQVLDVNAVGSVATNKIEDSAGVPRIEFNTTSRSVIVYVG